MSSPCKWLLDDDLREVFEFIPRQVLGNSLSLVSSRFNELAQSKMHVCRRHHVARMIVFGRQLRELEGREWRECCLALGDMVKYEPFYLPISPAIPENILGIQELVISHFSGHELVRFLTDCVGHFLEGCRLEIRFVESLLACGGTERAELDQFMQQFYSSCKSISVYSYERTFQMPNFLLQPNVVAKLQLLQLNDSIPSEHMEFFIEWLHSPNIHDGAMPQSAVEKKLQFRTGDKDFLDEFVSVVRSRFTTAAKGQVPFKVRFFYSSQCPANQIQHNWNFLDRNEQTHEILSLNSVFYPKMFELRRRAAEEQAMVMERLDEEGGCNLLMNVFRPADQQ